MRASSAARRPSSSFSSRRRSSGTTPRPCGATLVSSTPRRRTRQRAAWCSCSSRAKSRRCASSRSVKRVETIRNRVDQFGVAEPTISGRATTASWSSSRECRIPSGPRPSSARRPARVQARGRAGTSRSCAQRAVPEGAELLYQRRVDKETKQERKTPFVVQKRTLLTGGELHRREVSDRSEHDRQLAGVDRVQRRRRHGASATSPSRTSARTSPSSSTAMSTPRRASTSGSPAGAR